MEKDIHLISELRSRFPSDDKYLSMFDWLFSLNPSSFQLIIYTGENHGTFAADNWKWLLHFAITQNASCVSLVLRRFESGILSADGAPYKTISSAVFFDGVWYGMAEELMKESSERDAITGEHLSVELDVLFSGFCETYPSSPAIPAPGFMGG